MVVAIFINCPSVIIVVNVDSSVSYAVANVLHASCKDPITMWANCKTTIKEKLREARNFCISASCCNAWSKVSFNWTFPHFLLAVHADQCHFPLLERNNQHVAPQCCLLRNECRQSTETYSHLTVNECGFGFPVYSWWFQWNMTSWHKQENNRFPTALQDQYTMIYEKPRVCG